MDKNIISSKGKLPKRLRMTGRDGPAQLYYNSGLVRLCRLCGLARLCHSYGCIRLHPSGGPPGLASMTIGAPAWLARGNPVNSFQYKILDINKRISQIRQDGFLQNFVIRVKNRMTIISPGGFPDFIIPLFENKELKFITGSSNPGYKSFVLNIA